MISLKLLTNRVVSIGTIISILESAEYDIFFFSFWVIFGQNGYIPNRSNEYPKYLYFHFERRNRNTREECSSHDCYSNNNFSSIIKIWNDCLCKVSSGSLVKLTSGHIITKPANSHCS